MRPSSMEHYVGQEKVVGGSAVLRGILETGQVPSLIFWGPPGCGKVTIVHCVKILFIIAIFYLLFLHKFLLSFIGRDFLN